MPSAGSRLGSGGLHVRSLLSSATSWAPDLGQRCTKASHAMQANNSSATFRGAKAGQNRSTPLKTSPTKKYSVITPEVIGIIIGSMSRFY